MDELLSINECLLLPIKHEIKTKLYTKTPLAAAPFVLVNVASEIIVSVSSKVKIINFYTQLPSCRAIKILCAVILHDPALLPSK